MIEFHGLSQIKWCNPLDRVTPWEIASVMEDIHAFFVKLPFLLWRCRDRPTVLLIGWLIFLILLVDGVYNPSFSLPRLKVLVALDMDRIS